MSHQKLHTHGRSFFFYMSRQIILNMITYFRVRSLNTRYDRSILIGHSHIILQVYKVVRNLILAYIDIRKKSSQYIIPLANHIARTYKSLTFDIKLYIRHKLGSLSVLVVICVLMLRRIVPKSCFMCFAFVLYVYTYMRCIFSLDIKCKYGLSEGKTTLY